MEPTASSLASSFDLYPNDSQSSGSQDHSSGEESSATILSGTGDDITAPYQHHSTWDRTKRCWICDKHLTKLLGRRRHHCRWCGRTVCKKHALNRRQQEGQTKPLRICDVCHKDLVNQSHNAGLLNEMASIRVQLDLASKAIHERKSLATELGKDVERLKYELNSQETAAKESKSQLEVRLKDEVARLISNQARYTALESAVEESAESLTLTRDRLSKKQSEALTSRSEVAHLQEQQRVLGTDVERGIKNMQERVHIAQIAKLMCEPCRAKLYNSSFSEPSTEGTQAQRVRSQSVVERKACAGDCQLC